MANNDILTEDTVRQLIDELIAIEAAAREAQLSQEIINRQAGDDLLGQLITQEEEERKAAVSALQLATNQSITRIDGNVTQLQQIFNQKYDSLTVSVSGLTSAINVINGDENTVGSIAKALFDAKAYTDQRIEEVLDGAPQILDTLKELADAIGSDTNFFNNTTASLQSIQQALADEALARQEGDSNTLDEAKAYADAKKLELLNTLSQNLIKKVMISITQEHIDQGYVVLPAVNIVAGSMVAFLNRIAIFENEDFQVSTVEQAVRLTFLNNLAIGGDEAPQVGEQLRLTYWSL